jgi:hypothetical protein
MEEYPTYYNKFNILKYICRKFVVNLYYSLRTYCRRPHARFCLPRPRRPIPHTAHRRLLPAHPVAASAPSPTEGIPADSAPYRCPGSPKRNPLSSLPQSPLPFMDWDLKTPISWDLPDLEHDAMPPVSAVPMRFGLSYTKDVLPFPYTAPLPLPHPYTVPLPPPWISPEGAADPPYLLLSPSLCRLPPSHTSTTPSPPWRTLCLARKTLGAVGGEVWLVAMDVDSRMATESDSDFDSDAQGGSGSGSETPMVLKVA